MTGGSVNPRKRLIERFFRKKAEAVAPPESMHWLTIWWLRRREVRRRRKIIESYARAFIRKTPHEQIYIYIALLDRHPELRKAMRTALGIDARQLARPTLPAIVRPGTNDVATVNKSRFLKTQ
jgi:hypothetical protein